MPTPLHSPICPGCTRVITLSNESVEPFAGSPVRMHKDCAEYVEASYDHLDRVTRPGSLVEIVDAYRDTIAQAERSLAMADALRRELPHDWHYALTSRALSIVHQIQARESVIERNTQEPSFWDEMGVSA